MLACVVEKLVSNKLRKNKESFLEIMEVNNFYFNKTCEFGVLYSQKGDNKIDLKQLYELHKL